MLLRFNQIDGFSSAWVLVKILSWGGLGSGLSFQVNTSVNRKRELQVNNMGMGGIYKIQMGV